MTKNVVKAEYRLLSKVFIGVSINPSPVHLDDACSYSAAFPITPLYDLVVATKYAQPCSPLAHWKHVSHNSRAEFILAKKPC
jgi:hypothetical protein